MLVRFALPITADSGDPKSNRRRLWERGLRQSADELGLILRVCTSQPEPVRTLAKTDGSLCSWRQAVVPLAMERISVDGETLHLSIVDLDPERIAVVVEV